MANMKWCSHVDSHHEPSPSQGDVQISYTLRAEMVPEVGIAPTSPRLQRGANLPQLLGAFDSEGTMKNYEWIASEHFFESRRFHSALFIHHSALESVRDRTCTD